MAERKHLELAEVAKLLSEDSEVVVACFRHLVEVCPVCAEQLREVEALKERFRHWDPEVGVREGLEAEALIVTVLAAGQGIESWRRQVEEREELQTWGVAWVALEHAQELMTKETAQARDLALLAAAIAEHLGDVYHVEFVSDLKALAHATAAAAAERPPADFKDSRLEQVAAAVTALAKGTGAEGVAQEVWNLLSQVFGAPRDLMRQGQREADEGAAGTGEAR